MGKSYKHTPTESSNPRAQARWRQSSYGGVRSLQRSWLKTERWDADLTTFTRPMMPEFRVCTDLWESPSDCDRKRVAERLPTHSGPLEHERPNPLTEAQQAKRRQAVQKFGKDKSRFSLRALRK
eukprot:gnl/Hemi2/1418_TR495_c0_g2_i1.p2 gnl/Hemi2/1418_TR495_c0_g2~~gnl/Hemi2/1418_TR495_c0_g2_i1.p2  ORF type:complete len:124 (-),score=37.14 gnl/Hemi2/1418_TR495_c0_g2_i1:71-442(-)